MEITTMMNIDVSIDDETKKMSQAKFAYVVVLCDEISLKFLGAAVCYSKHHSIYYTNEKMFLENVSHLHLFVLGGYAQWTKVFPQSKQIISDSLFTKSRVFYETLLKNQFSKLESYRRIYSSCIAACRMMDFHRL
jgi:hypothetical protein